MENVVQFISNNFERIVIINGCWILLMGLAAIVIRLEQITLPQIKRFLKSLLFYGVVVAESSLLILTGYIVWRNYQWEDPRTFENRVVSTTRWVEDNRTIYFVVDDYELVSMKANGFDKATVLKTENRIREYHFSPDGQHILVVTDLNLFKLNRNTNKSELIDSLRIAEKQNDFKGVIRNVSWAPDSKKFCYEVARWSKIASQNNYYLYDLEKNKKRGIRNPGRKIPSFYWDKTAQNIYYILSEALDTSLRGYSHEIRVFRISLEKLRPELAVQIPSRTASIDPADLKVRDINLFLEASTLSFGRAGQKEFSWVSETGSVLGIDEDDQLFYVKHRWWRRRLYKVSRDPIVGDIPRYHNKGGLLSIHNVRWLPGGRYIIMGHSSLGILILEPATGKIGQLANIRGYTFGWYQRPDTL